MGFYTELLFNGVELGEGSLRPLRDSVRKHLKDKSCMWSYMLNYIYIIEHAEFRIIDLQISRAMKRELTKLYGRPPVPLNKLGDLEPRVEDEDSEIRWYVLDWYPYDVGSSGKWYQSAEFAAWVSAFCISGQIFELTKEDWGGLWGWEFREGRFRDLELRPKGRWRKPTPSKSS